MTNKTNILPYGIGGGMRKHRNAVNSVGHLTHTAFILS